MAQVSEAPSADAYMLFDEFYSWVSSNLLLEQWLVSSLCVCIAAELCMPYCSNTTVTYLANVSQQSVPNIARTCKVQRVGSQD